MGPSLIGDRIVIAFPVLKFHLIDMAYNQFTPEVASGSNVRYGSLADIGEQSGMSVFHHKAEILGVGIDFR
jgi:hypothetical protein